MIASGRDTHIREEGIVVCVRVPGVVVVVEQFGST